VLVLVDPGSVVAGTSRFVRGSSDGDVFEALKRLVRRTLVATFTTAKALLDTLRQMKPDVVFNLTQHALYDRTMDGHVCAMLELEGVPYTGTAPRGLILARDKALRKTLPAEAGFRVPRHFIVDSEHIKIPAGFPFPAVVKPRFGDASKYMSQRAVVSSTQALMARVKAIRREGYPDVICEEFVVGREITVYIYGDYIVWPREILYGRTGRGAPRIASTAVKHDPAYRRRWRIRSKFAEHTRTEATALRRTCTKAVTLLDMRDYGRFDLKLAPSGEWVFLEANPNPGLAKPGSSCSGHWNGVDYNTMMAEIVRRAWKRRASTTAVRVLKTIPAARSTAERRTHARPRKDAASCSLRFVGVGLLLTRKPSRAREKTPPATSRKKLSHIDELARRMRTTAWRPIHSTRRVSVSTALVAPRCWRSIATTAVRNAPSTNTCVGNSQSS